MQLLAITRVKNSQVFQRKRFCRCYVGSYTCFDTVLVFVL